MSLKKHAISGAKWTGIASIIAAATQLIQVIVLAHFLDKRDFGLMAIAVFVIGISQIFIDMGISNSIIHKTDVSREQLSTLYWINVIMGFGIFLTLMGFTPLLVIFYNEPALSEVLALISLTFLIQPFGQQYETLLRKELRFRVLSICDIISKIAGLVLGLSLAYLHFGVYALVYANLASVLIATILLIAAGRRLYRPGFIFSWKSLKKDNFFSFGLYQMGEKLIYYFNSQFDTILIGKFLGMEALVIYNIAKTLALRPSQIISPVVTKVAFPVLTKVRDNNIKLKEAYLRIVNFLSIISAPIYIIMIILAHPIIMLLFGRQWVGAAGVLQMLAISGFLIGVGEPVGSLQLAKGRADMGFYWNTIMFLFFPIVVWVGHYWGIVGIALALTMLRVIVFTWPVWRFFVYPLCNAGATEYFNNLLRPVLWAGIAGIATFALRSVLGNIYSTIFFGCLIFGIMYVLLYLLFEKEVVKEVKGFFYRGKTLISSNDL